MKEMIKFALVAAMGIGPAPHAPIVDEVQPQQGSAHIYTIPYFYPGDGTPGKVTWRTMCDTTGEEAFFVPNPASGPGETIDPNYTEVINYCVERGDIPQGYIPLGWGQTPIEEFKRQATAWKEMYGVVDIFADECPNDPQYLAYLQEAKAHVASLGGILTCNAGATAPEDWQLANDAVDILIGFEGSHKDYTTWKDTKPEWTKNYPAEKFGAIIYDVETVEDMMRIVAELKAAGIGNIYITNGKLILEPYTHPYGDLPLYFQELVDEIEGVTVSKLYLPVIRK